jgi:hypothetical protein
MWERLRQFSALEAPARRVFLRAAALLPLLAISLQRRGYRKTQARLQGCLSKNKKVVESSQMAERAASTARMVRAAVHHGLGHPTCLEESLALWFLLARQGIPSRVRFGVRKDAKKFEAHAWVECAGMALNEAEDMHRHIAAFEEALASAPSEDQ